MTDEKKYPHEGHRDRVKQRFLNVGMENMSDYEILEMLLFYAIPRKDTNDIAKNLIKKFGTLSDTLTAPIDELKKNGLSSGAAAYIKMLFSLCEKYHNTKNKKDMTAIAESNIAESLADIFKNAGQYQKVAAVLFDIYGKEICTDTIYNGSFKDTDMYMKKMLEFALKHHAWGMVIAHNHIDGTPMPSASDINVTHRIKNRANALNIKLIDHIIFSDNNYVAMSSLEEFKDIFLS